MASEWHGGGLVGSVHTGGWGVGDFTLPMLNAENLLNPVMLVFIR